MLQLDMSTTKTTTTTTSQAAASARVWGLWAYIGFAPNFTLVAQLLLLHSALRTPLLRGAYMFSSRSICISMPGTS